MPVLSVLTPVHSTSQEFLSETEKSVLSQQLPAGWQLEWIIQEDGEPTEIPQLLANDSRIRYAANGAHLGAAATRNLALSRVTGELLQNLDADDLLLPGSLATLTSAFTSDDRIHWAVGQADDLLPDGSRKSFPPDLPFGLVKPGQVNEWATTHEGNWPIHCAGVMYRTTSVRALGGWAAVPFDEDIVMFAALSQTTHGWFDQTLTWLYRQHNAQLIRSQHQQRWSKSGRRIALQRARAVDLAQLHLPGTGVDTDPSVSVSESRKAAVEL